LPFIQLVHFFDKLDLKVRDFLENLNLLFSDDLLERVDVEVEAMCEVEVGFGGFFNGLAKVILPEIIVEHQVIA
jgi:hypothetical protein